jgi:EamA domain-containing membrane protein RarD
MKRRRNVSLGVATGVVYALLYSGIAALYYLFSGEQRQGGEGIGLSMVIAVYFAGGITGGALVGFLWPSTRSRTGAVLVGILGFIPVCLGGALLLEDPFRDSSAIAAALILAIILGTWSGLFFWSPPDDAN